MGWMFCSLVKYKVEYKKMGMKIEKKNVGIKNSGVFFLIVGKFRKVIEKKCGSCKI